MILPVGVRASLHLEGILFFFSSRRRHTRLVSDWSSDVCSSDLRRALAGRQLPLTPEKNRLPNGLHPRRLANGSHLASPWHLKHADGTRSAGGEYSVNQAPSTTNIIGREEHPFHLLRGSLLCSGPISCLSRSRTSIRRGPTRSSTSP